MGIFFNQGQVCCAGSRFFVEQKIYDQFTDTFASSAASFKQGPGLDKESRLGPLVSQEQYERVLGYIDIGKKEGVRSKPVGRRISTWKRVFRQTHGASPTSIIPCASRRKKSLVRGHDDSV